jgi:hypothetical protein
MSDHPLAIASNSKKPHLKISYYDYQEWIQLIDQEKLSKWEILRFKTMNERYFIGRACIQIPVIGGSYYLSHILLGPPLRRRDAGFRDCVVFSTLIYFIIMHYLDQVPVPDPFLDELFTQDQINSNYLVSTTRRFYPSLWEDFKSQLEYKGFTFNEPQEKLLQFGVIGDK